MCATQFPVRYKNVVVQEKFPLHNKRDVGCSAAIRVSWGLLGMSSSYAAMLQADWEVSTTSIMGQVFGQPKMTDTYSQVPLQCGKLESVKTPKSICWFDWCRDLYLHTERWCYVHNLPRMLSFTSSISFSFVLNAWFLFIHRLNLSKQWVTLEVAVARIWCKRQTTVCLLTNFG